MVFIILIVVVVIIIMLHIIIIKKMLREISKKRRDKFEKFKKSESKIIEFSKRINQPLKKSLEIFLKVCQKYH